MRDGHRRVREIVAELRGVILRLSETAPRSSIDLMVGARLARPVPEPLDAAAVGPLAGDETERRDEMAEALAAAVQRLRARAQEQPFEVQRPEAARRRPSHKHSMSLIARLRAARKQRRDDR
jgi:hypothetical protein